MAAENIRDLRWTLEATVESVGRTGEEVIVLGPDGETELAVIISMEDYERLHEHADDHEARLMDSHRRIGTGDESPRESSGGDDARDRW